MRGDDEAPPAAASGKGGDDRIQSRARIGERRFGAQLKVKYGNGISRD